MNLAQSLWMFLRFNSKLISFYIGMHPRRICLEPVDQSPVSTIWVHLTGDGPYSRRKPYSQHHPLRRSVFWWSQLVRIHVELKPHMCIWAFLLSFTLSLLPSRLTREADRYTKVQKARVNVNEWMFLRLYMIMISLISVCIITTMILFNSKQMLF